ncbi:hypothetical protein ACIA8K_12525 [Catenuloplanes sp. NPDC051500]|uniref:hypothetical protein n=1 Tax=Catenuloplanes sp. NPDC051500 TaxID=3363959 RepID=UPI00378D9DC5
MSSYFSRVNGAGDEGFLAEGWEPKNEADLAAALLVAMGAQVKRSTAYVAAIAYGLDPARTAELVSLATVKVTWDE